MIWESRCDMWEGIMLICFGARWPSAIIKTLRVKDPKGKSFLFLTLVTVGYISGIIGKVAREGHECWRNWVFYLYLLAFAMVVTDFAFSVYYRNRNKKAEK